MALSLKRPTALGIVKDNYDEDQLKQEISFSQEGRHRIQKVNKKLHGVCNILVL